MNQAIKPRTSNLKPRRGGFTLTEILVAVGIIVLLIAITVPVVSKVRTSAQRASVQQQVSSLAAAIERYQADFRAYPGPLSNDQIRAATPTDEPPIFDVNGTSPMPGRDKITMSENLVLGLLGGLRRTVAAGGPTGTGGAIVFDFKNVGQGPGQLNPKQPKKYSPYAEPLQLSWTDGQPSSGTANTPGATSGVYVDDASLGRGNAGGAEDSPIPEFVDRFNNPMPILYLRARTAAKGVISFNMPAAKYQYDLNQIIGYTGMSAGNQTIGVGKDIKPGDYMTGPSQSPPPPNQFPHGLSELTETAGLQKGQANYRYPYHAFPYFQDPTIRPTDPASPNATGTPRKKDAFILISAGPDRVYGTADDITSFGDVAP